MVSEYGESDRDPATYLTYDEQAVSQDTIDRVIQTFQIVGYRTFDERMVRRGEVDRAVRESERRYRRAVQLRVAAIVAAVVLLVVSVVLVAGLVHPLAVVPHRIVAH
jgi:hypothetical protein